MDFIINVSHWNFAKGNREVGGGSFFSKLVSLSVSWNSFMSGNPVNFQRIIIGDWRLKVKNFLSKRTIGMRVEDTLEGCLAIREEEVVFTSIWIIVNVFKPFKDGKGFCLHYRSVGWQFIVGLVYGLVMFIRGIECCTNIITSFRSVRVEVSSLCWSQGCEESGWISRMVKVEGISFIESLSLN